MYIIDLFLRKSHDNQGMLLVKIIEGLAVREPVGHIPWTIYISSLGFLNEWPH